MLAEFRKESFQNLYLDISKNGLSKLIKKVLPKDLVRLSNPSPKELYASLSDAVTNIRQGHSPSRKYISEKALTKYNWSDVCTRTVEIYRYKVHKFKEENAILENPSESENGPLKSDFSSFERSNLLVTFTKEFLSFIDHCFTCAMKCKSADFTFISFFLS